MALGDNNYMPANGWLTVRRSFGDTECLPHLRLSQAERETPQFELLGKLPHLI